MLLLLVLRSVMLGVCVCDGGGAAIVAAAGSLSAIQGCVGLDSNGL